MKRPTIEELKATPEFQKILEGAALISSYGSPFEYRLNRFQEKDKLIKLTKYNKQTETITHKYFMKITDMYVYFNKSWEKNDILEVRVCKIPNKWEDKNFEYETEYCEEKFAKKLYYLDIPVENNKARNVSYWIDDDNIVYRKLEAQDRLEKRAWQVSAYGTTRMAIREKTLSMDTILSYKTERTMYTDENN